MTPRGTPSAKDTGKPPNATDMALPFCSGEAISAAAAPATGVQIAAQHAATTLVASSRENVGASAAATLASANRARAVTRSLLLSARPVTATKIGEPTA